MLCTQLQENTDVSKQQYRPGYAHYVCCILHLGMQTATMLHVHSKCCSTLIIYFMSVITKTICRCFIGIIMYVLYKHKIVLYDHCAWPALYHLILYLLDS